MYVKKCCEMNALRLFPVGLNERSDVSRIVFEKLNASFLIPVTANSHNHRRSCVHAMDANLSVLENYTKGSQTDRVTLEALVTSHDTVERVTNTTVNLLSLDQRVLDPAAESRANDVFSTSCSANCYCPGSALGYAESTSVGGHGSHTTPTFQNRSSRRCGYSHVLLVSNNDSNGIFRLL